MLVLREAALAALLIVLIPAACLGGGSKQSKAGCPLDSTQVGTLCVDKYEASVWSIPVENTSLAARVKLGGVTLAELTAGGATQIGAAPASCTGTEFPSGFPRNGNWTEPLYALSIVGVTPSACVSWYQAAQACALAGKRLLRAEEWQTIAAGSPDPGATDDGATQCNVAGAAASLAGARTACVSSWGAFDLLGNLAEWSATWGEKGDGCSDLSIEFGNGEQCIGGDPAGNRITALVLGDSYLSGDKAAIFSVRTSGLETQSPDIGFRCARDLITLSK